MDQRSLCRFDPEDFVRDLREGRFEPLPMRMHADPQFETTIGGQSRRSLLVARHHRNAPPLINRSTVRTLLAENRQPDTDAACPDTPRLALADPIEADRGNGAAQALRVVAAVEMLAGDVVERHCLGRTRFLSRTS